MGRNIEIKAHLRDRTGVIVKLHDLGAVDEGELIQTDSFFTVPTGRLKLREFADGGAELIYYLRPNDSETRESRYRIVPIAEPAPLHELLAAALGLLGVVRKRRRLFMIGRTRVHLDSVEGLGEYLELEVVLGEGEESAGGHNEAQRLQAALEIADNDRIALAYIDLLAAATAGNPCKELNG